MTLIKYAAAAAMLLLALTGCGRQPPTAAEVAADEAAVRAINPQWFKAYAAGDADAITALYASDAVFSAPGAPSARGSAAIHEWFVKSIAETRAAGVSFKAGPSTDVGVSGDLGWEYGTFSVIDKSGATVDTGKYVSVAARKDGKWTLVRDIYNTDTPPAPPAPPPAPAPAAKAKKTK